MDFFDDMERKEEVSGATILAVSNRYEKLYYFNEDFEAIPKSIQEDIRVLLVMHTEEVGGILVLGFTEEGEMYFEAMAKEDDVYYDEIGSHLKIKKYQREKKELLEALEEFYRCFF